MDNVLETNGVPLTVFGGAVPELAPEDLPEGAAPFNQDVDFNPGSVFTRGGRQNQIFYSNLFIEKICQTCISAADPGSSNETAWSSPGNATLNVPGTYASVSLNFGGGGIAGAPYVDGVALNSSGSTVPSATVGPLTPTQSNEFALLTQTSPILTVSGFTLTTVQFWFLNALTSSPINPTLTFNGNQSFEVVMASLFTNGTLPTIVSGNNFASAGINNAPSLTTLNLPHPTTAGKTIIVSMTALGQVNWAAGSITDDGSVPGTYVLLGFHQTGALRGVAMWGCNNSSGATHIIWTPPASFAASGGTMEGVELNNIISPSATFAASQELQGSNFAFNIPAGKVPIGFQVEVSGNQTDQSGSSKIVASVANPSGGGVTVSGQLPASDGTIFIGSPITGWNLPLTANLLNAQTFSVQIQAQTVGGAVATFNVYALKVKVFLAPPAANYNWIKSYEQTNGQVDTLTLDSNGILYDEQVNYGTGPGTLNSIFLNIFPNTFAKGVTFGDIEYIAFSNLVNGTDIPRQWNSVNFDRISQVGPGTVPQVSSSGGSGGSNTIAIQSITQYAPVQIRRIAWGTVNSPSDSTPGNLLVIFGEGRTGANTYQSLFPYTSVFGAGTTVVLSGIPTPFPKKDSGSLPYNINGTYSVQQVTTGIVGGNESCPIFTIPSPATVWAYSADFGSSGPPPTSGWFYQSCLATVTLQSPLPNVGVGSTIQLAGTGGYDGTWPVLQAPNASQMLINNAQLTSFSCSFSYTLLAGSVPQVGQIVTISNCLNNGQFNPNPGVFNGTFTIASVTGGTNGSFTVGIANQVDTGLQTQGGSPQATASIGGTIFVFDAGAIVGNKTGGTVVGQGQIGVGVRKVCYCFQTRSGFITQPSPIATFNVTSGSSTINISNLATGPPNVVARIVCFTGANGGNFFYIPQTVNVTVGGVNQVNTSTIINDNTSQTWQFNFSDAVLLTATAIDIPGNNLFNCIELGSSRGLLTYGSRMFAWSEQQKITNLRNLSFDGGTLQGGTVPLGWTLDATSGSGGSLNPNSPVFGWAYQIQNTSGSTQAAWGMLTQPAYQDEFGVPIVQANTAYSVRICAQVNPAQASGNMIVDLFSPGTGGGTVLGSFSVPLVSLTTSMGMYTGTLLTTLLKPVPGDLVIRIWAQNILNGATILIDRVEPFQTLVPTNTTAFKVSYASNQESFDLNTGVCGPAQNMQPINGAMELFDLLYALKERSWFSTFDNGVTEPFKWNWKEVSNKVGTIGINSYDWGEGWALSGNREGVFFFEGGEPIKVSQEIQPLWDLINWTYGYTMWVRNDPEQRRFMVGVPLPTPNIYMPEFPVNANPTSPNVILMCNYRELNTGAALAQTGPIRSTFTGRLMSPEPARKWSFWNILCPYSDYIDRANNQWPQWFCTGYLDNKIFQLQASQLSDDGLAINSFTLTYGFVKPEMQDAKGLGLYRMEIPYFTVLATGTGTLNSFVYPESPQNQPYILQPQPLPAITQGDIEIGVNVKGQRFFFRIGTNAVGAGFRCSKMVVPLIVDSWSPVRGSNLSFA